MSEKKTLIKCGKLFDGIHEELFPNMEILVEENRIVEVAKNISVSRDTDVVDLTDTTVTPGMIDAHVHMSMFDYRDASQKLLASCNYKTLAILHCAQRTLHRGFTTVREIGTYTSIEGYDGMGVFDVRNAINAGYFEGARIVAAPIFLCTPGSHGDGTQFLRGNQMLSELLQRSAPGTGSGKDFFINAVREQIKYGSDFIKIMATGGFFSPNDSPLEQQLNDEELQAIINTAKELGKTVTAHAYTPELVSKLIRFGIDGIEHAAMIDEETARLIEDKGRYVVPTFCPYDEIINGDEAMLAKKPPAFRKKLISYRERLINGREVIKNSNIKLGYGTDLVAVHQNYESGYEYSTWLNSGMDPYRALKAATSVNAEILQIPEIGSIEPGKLADISAWKKDLLTDPNALLDCAFVMKDGVVYPTEK